MLEGETKGLQINTSSLARLTEHWRYKFRAKVDIQDGQQLSAGLNSSFPGFLPSFREDNFSTLLVKNTGYYINQ